MAKKEKEVVVDEVWTEARISEFLDVKPAEDVEADYHALMKAYQQMRADDFAKFVDMFVAQGRNVNARNPDGRTAISFMRDHVKSSEYVEILQRHGAE
jgi:hypothetical protein